MKWERLCELARELPEVTVERWYATPGLKVCGKGFCRLKEDGVSVMFGTDGLDEKEALLATRPDLYFTTPHYDGWPAVLARLARLRVPEARSHLAWCWRQAAPRRVVAAYDAAKPGAKRKPIR